MFLPDAWHACIALGPAAVYLLLLGMIQLSRRPFVTTGARDASALGVATVGFVVAGPMELFMPDSAASHFGGYVWLMMLVLYSLLLSLTILLMRPRLVIYNVDLETLRPALARAAMHLDPEVRWAGDSLAMPNQGVRLSVESFGGGWNVQLVATSAVQNIYGWRMLEVELTNALSNADIRRHPFGWILVGMAALLLSGLSLWMAASPAELAQGLDQMLHP